MIRYDVMNKLNGECLDKIFLPNRKNFDQDNYRVAEIDNEVLCWNPENDLIMDYFYDDRPEQIWFDLKLVIPEMNVKNKFEINRDGLVKKSWKNGESIKKIFLDSSGYPMYIISLDSIKKDTRIAIHRLLAKLFIPNTSSDRFCVDHKNRNILDYSLENLRWVTVKENNKNKGKPKFTGNKLYNAYRDAEHNELVLSLSEEDLLNSKDYNKSSIRNNLPKYKGLFWEIIDLNIKNYLREGETIDESLWVLHYSNKIYAHPLGLIKSAPRPWIISVGNHSKKYSLYDGSKAVHRIIAEVFLNGNKPLSKNLQVDHLDTDTYNNRVENLRICTREENMNNPLTLEANRRKVIAEGVIYESISKCAEHYKVTRQAIKYRIDSKFQKDFCFYEE